MSKKGQKQKVKSAEELLTHDEKLEVIKWFVELRSTGEIVDLVKDEFDKTITRQGIWRYRNSNKWKPVIARLRTRFEKSILKIPIANKVDRVRYLQQVVREGLKWSLKTVTKDGEEIYELKLGAVTQALKEARVEMEGEKPLIDKSKHYHYDLGTASNKEIPIGNRIKDFASKLSKENRG